MQYELYVDSLFLIHFVMNLYILILVNYSTNRTATPFRLLSGAFVGAMGSVIVFFINGSLAFKLFIEVFVGSFGMLFITFRVKGFRNWMKLLEKTVMTAMCMGGVLLVLTRIFRLQIGVLAGTFSLTGMGGAACLLLAKQLKRGRRETKCRTVTLIRGKNRVKATALFDTGNSLVEPISGKPVSVVDEKLFSCLWEKDEQVYYRAIPYHSIGKPRGILRGYLLPELWLEQDGMKRVYRDIYIAVSPEQISTTGDARTDAINMIINPLLFFESGRNGVHGGQNERKYDFKSVNAGENAVQNDSQ